MSIQIDNWKGSVALGTPTDIYTDGSVIGSNPSQYGGPWAWLGIDLREGLEPKSAVCGAWGVVEGYCTNNVSEFYAMLAAIEAMPMGWRGRIWSDSLITVNRMFHNAPTNGMPRDLIMRAQRALLFKEIECIHLSGHPTKTDLALGHRKGRPVSVWNVQADHMATKAGRAYMNWRIEHGQQAAGS